jgi:hypothetical protein
LLSNSTCCTHNSWKAPGFISTLGSYKVRSWFPKFAAFRVQRVVVPPLRVGYKPWIFPGLEEWVTGESRKGAVGDWLRGWWVGAWTVGFVYVLVFVFSPLFGKIVFLVILPQTKPQYFLLPSSSSSSSSSSSPSVTPTNLPSFSPPLSFFSLRLDCRPGGGQVEEVRRGARQAVSSAVEETVFHTTYFLLTTKHRPPHSASHVCKCL